MRFFAAFQIPGKPGPALLHRGEDYAVVYKPPLFHSVFPSKKSGGKKPCLLDWCLSQFPGLEKLQGKRPGEGGLSQRLDYGTDGLVLLALTQKRLDAFLAQQEEGLIAKEYSALASEGRGLPGFPRGPAFPPGGWPLRVESAFRPFGPGGKAVRPVLEKKPGKDFILDRGNFYNSLVEEAEELETAAPGLYRFRVRIFRGFRHQIRCHLAWLGFPLLNDRLYGGTVLPKAGEDPRPLGLRARGLSFPDPAGEGTINFSLPELSPGVLE